MVEKLVAKYQQPFPPFFDQSNLVDSLHSLGFGAGEGRRVTVMDADLAADAAEEELERSNIATKLAQLQGEEKTKLKIKPMLIGGLLNGMKLLVRGGS